MADPNYTRFRIPRIWSNEELRKFAHLFTGAVVNVSGWKDEDKEGGYYKDYFTHAASYSITNFKSEARGFQGQPNEVFLDLTADLTAELESKYDVVFNHTTLEHIFEVEKAFHNICKMSRDVVILVVPFLQEMHGLYGDFWRFTPQAIEKLFEKNGLELLYLTFNIHVGASVYIFAIASKKPDDWNEKIERKIMKGIDDDRKNGLIGYNALPVFKKSNTLFARILRKTKSFFG